MSKKFDKRKKVVYDLICDDLYTPMKFKELAMLLRVAKEDRDELRQILEALEPDYIRGLSLLGGEPLEPEHQAALLPLLRRFSRLYPDKTIWCYTGYDFELDLLTGRVGDWSVTQEFLSYLNVLVDGPFVLKEKDITLRFRGSRNQRVIDVPKSLITDQVVWWEDEFGIGIPD